MRPADGMGGEGGGWVGGVSEESGRGRRGWSGGDAGRVVGAGRAAARWCKRRTAVAAWRARVCARRGRRPKPPTVGLPANSIGGMPGPTAARTVVRYAGVVGGRPENSA